MNKKKWNRALIKICYYYQNGKNTVSLPYTRDIIRLFCKILPKWKVTNNISIKFPYILSLLQEKSEKKKKLEAPYKKKIKN